MPKPSTKAELLAESQEEFAALEELIAPLDETQLTQPGTLGPWSVKDTLAHLYEWQQLFFGWYEAGLRGETPQTPGRGYKWNQLAALNEEIYQTYQDTPLHEVRAKLRESHRRMVALVESLAEEILLTPCYTWTGSHPLVGFISANTGNHYRWARTEMRKTLKPKRAAMKAG